MTGWELYDGDTVRVKITRAGKVTDVVDMTVNLNTNKVDVSRPEEAR